MLPKIKVYLSILLTSNLRPYSISITITATISSNPLKPQSSEVRCVSSESWTSGRGYLFAVPQSNPTPVSANLQGSGQVENI